jgi:hypothetical protein
MVTRQAVRFRNSGVRNRTDLTRGQAEGTRLERFTLRQQIFQAEGVKDAFAQCLEFGN